MKVEFNVNDTCYVKLTQYGRKLLKLNHIGLHGSLSGYIPKKEDMKVGVNGNYMSL